MRNLLNLMPKPKVFVSYHHDNDQQWYDSLIKLCSEYDLITDDNSLDRLIHSDDTEYVMRKIREDYVTGSSLTIVLCGSETWKRKYVDWEIYATLEKEHALLGIILPSSQTNQQGQYIVPDRLATNVTSGYAHWTVWSTDPKTVNSAISSAKIKANNTRAIDNSQEMMTRNIT